MRAAWRGVAWQGSPTGLASLPVLVLGSGSGHFSLRAAAAAPSSVVVSVDQPGACEPAGGQPGLGAAPLPGGLTNAQRQSLLRQALDIKNHVVVEACVDAAYGSWHARACVSTAVATVACVLGAASRLPSSSHPTCRRPA